jgi:hypothetical protein
MNPKLNELATEIDGARSQLLHVVSDVTDGAMNDRPDRDHWSIGEILHHLFLIESQVTTLLQKQILRAKDRGIGADPSSESMIHSLDRFAIETVIEKIAAPLSVAPTMGLARSELLGLLAGSREKLRHAMEEADGIDLGLLQFPHPVLGRIDMYQWILYLGKHERRHIAQIARVKGE